MIHSSQGLRFFICSIILDVYTIFMVQEPGLRSVFGFSKNWLLKSPMVWPSDQAIPQARENANEDLVVNRLRGATEERRPGLARIRITPTVPLRLRGKKSQDFMSYQNGTKFQEMSNEAKHNQGTKSCGCTTMAVRAKMARQTSAMQTRHVLPSLIREYIEYHRRLIQDMQTKAYTRIDWLDRLDMHFLSFICVHDT